MNIFIIDGREMTDKNTAHEHLKKVLNLPEHYGKNLDALYDCLSEMKGQVVISYVAEMQDSLRRYADNIIGTFEAAAEKNPKLSVIVEELVDEL